jgi:hypothetical protein
VQLRAAEPDLPPEPLESKGGSCRLFCTTLRTFVRKASSIGVTPISLGLSTTGPLNRSRGRRRWPVRLRTLDERKHWTASPWLA